MNYLIFDTETTGLPRNYKAPVTDGDNWPRLVQLAFLEYNSDAELVRGNHDRQNGMKLRRLIHNGKPLLHDYCDIKFIKLDGKRICLSHYPYNDDRLSEYSPSDTGLWLLHGHVHKRNGHVISTTRKSINVGCMLWDYAPVSEERIMQLMYAMEVVDV